MIRGSWLIGCWRQELASAAIWGKSLQVQLSGQERARSQSQSCVLLGRLLGRLTRWILGVPVDSGLQIPSLSLSLSLR